MEEEKCQDCQDTGVYESLHDDELITKQCHCQAPEREEDKNY